MRGRRSLKLMLGCALVLAQSAALSAQEAGPPTPDDSTASLPTSPPSAEPEPAPAPAVAPAAAPAAPRPAASEANTPPAPPPPERDGAYGGRVQTQARRRPANDDDYDQGAAEPDDDGGPRQKREFSIRLDPFNWLIEGRLGIELEMTAWKFISVELVPILVTNTSPPAVNLSGFDSALSQHSNGIGPFSGARLGAGLWLSGTPFEGYVLRLDLTNYGYTYESKDGAGVIDKVSFTERRLIGFFGSHSRWGPFTLAGGIGLGYELNQQERCKLTHVASAGDAIEGVSTGCKGELQIGIDRSSLGSVANLNGSLHPVYLEFRFSLGFVF